MDLGSRNTHFLHPEITLVILFHCGIYKSPGSIVVNPGMKAALETAPPFFFPDTASTKINRLIEAAGWVREEHDRGLYGQSGLCGQCGQKEPWTPTYPELAANAALVLLAVACSLLDRQLAAQAAAFETEGGFTERLYRLRSGKRTLPSSSTRSTKSTPSTTD